MLKAIRQAIYEVLSCGLLASIALGAVPTVSTSQNEHQNLGPLSGLSQWSLSERKNKEALASAQVVSPGLSGSQRAILLELHRDDAARNSSAQRAFGPLRGNKIAVEFTVQPSSNQRSLGIAVRGGGVAAAYLRLSGSKPGLCEQYDNENKFKFREIAPFKANAPNRLRIEVNTRLQTIKAWVNGAGGQQYPFHGATDYVDRVDLFMSHGRSSREQVVVDDVLVQDDEGYVVLAEDFERYYDNKRANNEIPSAAIPVLAPSADGAYQFKDVALVYRPIEIEFHAHQAGKNPYIDGPEVTCTLTGITGKATGKQFKVAGFWDGKDSWRVRFAPTAPGNWRFETDSSDPGLNAKHGVLTARAATDEEVAGNPLLRGYLEASGRTFRLSDGSQFLPVGDSQFAFTEELFDEEWRDWVNALHERKFNSFLGMVWLGKYTRAGVSPFRNFDPASDQINVDFFQRLDRWVAYANDRGILMGLAPGGFPADSQQWWVRFQTRDREDRYFKYIVARYAAFNVRWLMYGEVNERNPPWKVKWDDEVRHKAELVKSMDPYQHPIGCHHTSADLKTIGSQYIDYLDYQDSGHHDHGVNSPATARRHANESHGKPIWSEEFWYSAPYYVQKNQLTNEAGTRCLHLNFLSGLAFPTLGSLMRAHSNHEAFPPAEAAKAGVSLERYLLDKDESLKRFSAFGRFYSELPLNNWECTEFDPIKKNWTARFGEQFVTYLAPAQTKQLDLAAYAGKYRATALLIQTDELIDLGEFAGGKTITLSLAAHKTDEAVVKLVRQMSN